MMNRILLITLLSILSLPLAAKQIPPKSNTLVTDYIGLLNAGERDALERKLVAYDDSTSTQIAVVIDGSLEGEDIFDYSLRLAQSWGIGGSAESDNGVLIYIAFPDRKLFIQTGYGAEGFLPDAMAKRIIEQVIKPAFRQERYYEGLDRATDVVMQLGSGEYVREGGRSSGSGGGGFPFFTLFLIILVIIILGRLLGGGDDDDGGYGGGGRYDHPRRRRGGWIFFPTGGGGWSGGGGGGWSGGGGFGGFGGGGFGGGGAGGDW